MNEWKRMNECIHAHTNIALSILVFILKCIVHPYYIYTNMLYIQVRVWYTENLNNKNIHVFTIRKWVLWFKDYTMCHGINLIFCKPSDGGNTAKALG